MEFCKNEANKPRSLELPAFIGKPARVKLVHQFTIQVQNCLQVTLVCSGPFMRPTCKSRKRRSVADRGQCNCGAGPGSAVNRRCTCGQTSSEGCRRSGAPHEPAVARD